VISGAEVAAMQTAVAGYNAHIASVATAHGWALVDVNAALQFARNNIPGAILPFPDVSLLPAGPIYFGTLFSLDGIHPSSAAHQLIADSVASMINQTYGTTLPVPVCGTVTCPAP
jgi:lysophospholipase L1-like esterase